MAGGRVVLGCEGLELSDLDGVLGGDNIEFGVLGGVCGSVSIIEAKITVLLWFFTKVHHAYNLICVERSDILYNH